MRRRVVKYSDDERRTKQEGMHDSSPREIMRLYRQTRDPRVFRGNAREAMFGDFSDVGDFRDCMEKLQHANSAFLTLDPEVRAVFSNDPGDLLAFLDDPDNRAEAVELGLVEPTQEEREAKLQAELDALREAAKASEAPEEGDDEDDQGEDD